MSSPHKDELQWVTFKENCYTDLRKRNATYDTISKYYSTPFMELNWKEIAFKKRKYFDREEDLYE
jgi:hypothetical protein